MNLQKLILSDNEWQSIKRPRTARAKGIIIDVVGYTMVTQQALDELLGILTELMATQVQEARTNADANLNGDAAQACLQHVAAAVKDAVVGPITTFVAANSSSADWRRRDAAAAERRQRSDALVQRLQWSVR